MKKKKYKDLDKGVAIGISLGFITGLLLENLALGFLIGASLSGLMTMKNSNKKS